jgi:hypothetical protein
LLRLQLLHHADVAQLVERDLAKVEVAGSSPVVRSKTALLSAVVKEGLHFKLCGSVKRDSEEVSMQGWPVRRKFIVVVLSSLTLTCAPALSASAAPKASGVITGKVVECGPGPIVSAPNFPAPLATPASVILVHDRVAFASQAIAFPSRLPWTGTFSFTVPAGRYEVISTYHGDTRWVIVRPHHTSVVTFALFACPL